MKRKTWYWISGGVTAAALALLFPVITGGGPSVPKFEAEPGTLGDITSEITATGTLEAVGTVEVGTQVSGVLAELNADFNQRVKKGQVLAKLDTRNLQAVVTESEAAVERATVTLEITRKNFERTDILHQQGMSSDAELENARGDYLTAKANVSTASAQLNRNRVNLELATISAPMDGIILSRNVEPGQTVAASFNTPTLFTLAADLKVMEIEADVDEADIGQVKKGQPVRFSVDAWPGKDFTGQVDEVRLQPVISQNVVTYTVIVSVNNDEEKLMPGMTATLSIQTSKASGVFSVPASAVNLTLSETQADQFKAAGFRVEATVPAKDWIWIAGDRELRQLAVTTGFSNGSRTELKLPGMDPASKVLTSVSATESLPAATRSPFLPSPPSNRKN